MKTFIVKVIPKPPACIPVVVKATRGKTIEFAEKRLRKNNPYIDHDSVRGPLNTANWWLEEVSFC
jgi:hypothetical protein